MGIAKTKKPLPSFEKPLFASNVWVPRATNHGAGRDVTDLCINTTERNRKRRHNHSCVQVFLALPGSELVSCQLNGRDPQHDCRLSAETSDHALDVF